MAAEYPEFLLRLPNGGPQARGERCLLFVACTRAREALAVTWSGSASSFVP